MPDVISLLHHADWTRLSLSAEVEYLRARSASPPTTRSARCSRLLADL
jgi:hypothetical protein